MNIQDAITSGNPQVREALRAYINRQLVPRWQETAWGRSPKRLAAAVDKAVTNPVAGVLSGFLKSPEAEGLNLTLPTPPMPPPMAATVPAPAPMPEPPMPPAPKPPAPKPPAPAPASTGNALVDGIIHELNKAGYKPGVDADAISKMVSDEVAAALANYKPAANAAPPQTVSYQVRNAPAKTVSGVTPDWWEDAIVCAAARVPQLWRGPAGCGKGYWARKLAEVLNLAFYSTSLTAGIDEGALVGNLLPIDPERAGVFTYVPSAFIRAYENGGVMLLDEMDAADPNMLMIINDAIENGSMSLPHRPDQPVATKHDDFVLVATANTFGHGADRAYVGRNQLDEATLSRFRAGQIDMDYDERIEKGLVSEAVFKYGTMLRARCRAHAKTWKRDVSTRDMVNIEKKMAVHVGKVQMTCERAWYQWFADWTDSDLTKVSAVRSAGLRTVELR